MAKAKRAAPASAPTPEYTVLARRYRPQQFADLVGQEPVARALVNALKSNRVAHAYLFTGARGVGKTSCARILAKALNCVEGPTATPCDTCDPCKGIASGEDVDVLEIDAASNRGIDEIRDIRSNVQYRPSRARYKIYIIDEVHMLTREAFNALLKTLEEPPSHVKFIFATTEVQKIPVTILSRCQRFDFNGIGTPQIVERLREILQREQMEADDEALELVARRAGGSMRDAQSLLDQLLAFGGDRLTAEAVHQLLGTAQDERVIELASAILSQDTPRGLDLLGQVADQGAQLGELLDQMIAYWRDLMVLHCAGDQARNLSVASRHRETLSKQAQQMKLDSILAGLDVLSTTKARLRASGHGRILLEMAVIRLGRLEELVSLTQLGQWLSEGRITTSAGPGSTPPATSLKQRLSSSPPTQPPEGVKKKYVTEDEKQEKAALTEASLSEIWPEVLAQVGPAFAGYLKKAGIPAIPGPNNLVLRFGAQYNHLREYCQEPDRLKRIEEVLLGLTGQACAVRVESAGNAPTEGTAETAEETANSQSRYRRQRVEVSQEPLIQRAIDVLGGQLVHVDEGFNGAPAGASEREAAPDLEE